MNHILNMFRLRAVLRLLVSGFRPLVSVLCLAALTGCVTGCVTSSKDSWVWHISHTTRPDAVTYHGHLDLFPEYNQASPALKNMALWNGWSILPNPLYGSPEMFGLYGGVQNWEQ